MNDVASGHRPWWAWAMPVLGLALAVAIPLLVWYGAQAILESTDGDLEEVITDPREPGFETLVVATPSHLLLSTDGQERLSMAAIVALASNDLGGTVLLIPPETQVDSGERLEEVFASDGVDGAHAAVAALVDVDFDSVGLVDLDGWFNLTGPTAPLSIFLPEALQEVDGEGNPVGERFPSGTISVENSEVGDVISWVNPGEDHFNRLARQRRFWTAWIDAVRESDDPGVVPGEIDRGLGRMIRGLGSGIAVVETAPVVAAPTDDGPAAFLVDETELEEIIFGMFPFPLPAPAGSRPRVRLLDGVGELNVATEFSPALVRAGAQIVVIGNASEFGVADTSVIYHDESFADQAADFADALGGAQLTFEPVLDAVLDITVIIGDDQQLA